MDEETLSASAFANTGAFQRSQIELRWLALRGADAKSLRRIDRRRSQSGESEAANERRSGRSDCAEHNDKLDDTQVETR